MNSQMFWAVIALGFSTLTARGYWLSVLQDDFSASSASWTYAGVTNSNGDPLFACDTNAGNVSAEWDQSNWLIASGDPYTILPSRLSRPLGRTLTDCDTFRFGATLTLTPGSIPDTDEFYQIANLGLYNLAEMGPDRAMADYGWGNTNEVKDGSDFVDFCYFINTNFDGRNITAVIGAHADGAAGLYTTGEDWTQTVMADDRLPEGLPLYIEVVYHGADTGAMARTAVCSIYTEAERTNVLQVNGKEMVYRTQTLPLDRSFTLTDLAFYNYVNSNWGGASGAGRGTFDDAYVDCFVAPGNIFARSLRPEGLVITWASEPGTTYYAQFSTNPASGLWETSAVMQASGEALSCTNVPEGKEGWFRVTH